MWENIKTDIKELLVVFLVTAILLVCAVPLIAAIILLFKYAPEWVIDIVAFGWIPVLLFWKTISGAIKRLTKLIT